MAQTNPVRPFGITLLMVFGLIAGLANIAVGVFTIIDRNSLDLIVSSHHSPNQLVAAGVAAIVFGTIQLFLAAALGHASNVVRIIYAVIASLNLAAGVWSIFALTSEQRASGVLATVFSGLVLYFLFNEKADRFFVN